MRRFLVTLAGAVGLLFVGGSAANAQERPEPFAQPMAAPSNALELKVGTGYTQGFGNISPVHAMGDVAGPGIGVSVDFDYRLNHLWSLGIEGQYQELHQEQNTAARGMAINGGVTYHFAPVVRGDPWVRLGSGYRWLWETDPTGMAGVEVLRHGFDILTAKIGYDVRVSEDVAVAPVIGADLNAFVWEAPSNAPGYAMSAAQVATFVYAGLQGRFDLGGDRGGVQVAEAPPPVQPEVGVTERQPEAVPPPPPVAMTPASPSIAVSEDVLRDCKLNLDAIDKAPRFDFDQTALVPADHAVLDQIGTCFTTGPLKDAKLHLIGRADPRGTIAYNDRLGSKRAAAVAAYLKQLGVAKDHITLSSRGKLDAKGRDEPGWAIDRRVDVLER
jgi:outer membrane protein OmpA-like peptidoglycan-associated protein/opacity protein-like surface antigen